MITNEYIDEFKTTNTFLVLKNGLTKGAFDSVLQGKDGYRITNQFDNSILNTVPSQVLITAHILVIQNELNPSEFSEAFENLELNSETLCLILEYVLCFKRYMIDHSEISIDLNTNLLKVQKFAESLESTPPYCYKVLIEKISAIK